MYLIFLRETEMLRPIPYCDAVSRRDDTKTIKPIINEAFVASSGNIIISDYTDLYCLLRSAVTVADIYPRDGNGPTTVLWF